MPGSNNGTGYPISFRCSQCRIFVGQGSHNDLRRRLYGTRGRADRVRLTGKTRTPRRRGYRQSGRAFEYRCLDCGHVGWSQHSDLEYVKTPGLIWVVLDDDGKEKPEYYKTYSLARKDGYEHRYLLTGADIIARNINRTDED